MKCLFTLLLAIGLICLHKPIQAQDTATINRLAGSWIYSGFETIGEHKISKSAADKAEKANKGVIITFASDGHYKIWKKVNGKKETIASGKTQLTNEGKHLSIEGLDGDIYVLNKDYLKLFKSEDRPLMVFKKYSD